MRYSLDTFSCSGSSGNCSAAFVEEKRGVGNGRDFEKEFRSSTVVCAAVWAEGWNGWTAKYVHIKSVVTVGFPRGAAAGWKNVLLCRYIPKAKRCTQLHPAVRLTK